MAPFVAVMAVPYARHNGGLGERRHRAITAQPSWPYG
jgi:hypothetical protein